MTKNEIEKLESELMNHKALYYQGRPDINDTAYDELEDLLRKHNPESYVLESVGIETTKGKVEHDRKMLSLAKTYKKEDLKTWMGEQEIVSMYKIDGVSGSLVYENQKLVLAKTRGNGSHGEDITDKVLWMSCVPKNINEKEKVEIRGEIYCTEKDFLSLANEMENIGLERPTSQRNIVAGLISRKENKELCRYLSFKSFDWISEKDLVKETMKFDLLKKNNFDITEYEMHKSFSTVARALETAKEFMSNGEYQIDGLVFVLNEISMHEELGETAHHPRYKMAFKYPGVSKNTIIEKINWSVSRNGILTPVANVEPVELSGAMISRVTLHNYGQVNQYQLKTGDIIEIIRSGEVIPKFLSVVKSSESEMTIPKRCPSCRMEVLIKDIRIICTNKECPGINKEVILNFIQKIGIDDLSSKRLEEMMSSKLVRTIPDLYELTEESLLTLSKTKERLAKKLLKSISKSKNVSLTSFLASLGISGGAYNKCEKLVLSGYNTIEKIMEITEIEMLEVESFAEKSAHDFRESLRSKNDLVSKLIEKGFTFEENTHVKEGPVTGKKICITGSLAEKRSFIESRIRDAGGVCVSTVSKKTDYLLTNEKEAKSSKYKKALSLDIKIISEQELKVLIS